MNRVFRVLASCVFAAVIAFGSVVGGAFAATTPNPSNFSFSGTQSKIVELNPEQSSFTAVYSTPTFQGTTISVLGGSCQSQRSTRLRKIVGWVEALRNPTKPPKCWVSFLNPTYTG
jgi:hypothetical protein